MELIKQSFRSRVIASPVTCNGGRIARPGGLMLRDVQIRAGQPWRNFCVSPNLSERKTNIFSMKYQNEHLDIGV